MSSKNYKPVLPLNGQWTAWQKNLHIGRLHTTLQHNRQQPRVFSYCPSRKSSTYSYVTCPWSFWTQWIPQNICSTKKTVFLERNEMWYPKTLQALLLQTWTASHGIHITGSNQWIQSSIPGRLSLCTNHILHANMFCNVFSNKSKSAEFKNNLFEEVAFMLGTKYKTYSPLYRHQSNGRIEGFHKFLKTCISKHISPQVECSQVIHLAYAT